MKPLIDVLEETREYLARPENDFVDSPFHDAYEASQAMQIHIQRLSESDVLRLQELRVLFAPTGAIQDVSLSGGWANEFLSLAERFDRAVAALLLR